MQDMIDDPRYSFGHLSPGTLTTSQRRTISILRRPWVRVLLTYATPRLSLSGIIILGLVLLLKLRHLRYMFS